MKRIIAFLLCLVLVCLPASSLAHSGRTDANGGHYDSSTGEYHYHHGYSAHQHPNGVCPYSYSYNTNYSEDYDYIDEDQPMREDVVSELRKIAASGSGHVVAREPKKESTIRENAWEKSETYKKLHSTNNNEDDSSDSSPSKGIVAKNFEKRYGSIKNEEKEKARDNITKQLLEGKGTGGNAHSSTLDKITRTNSGKIDIDTPYKEGSQNEKIYLEGADEGYYIGYRNALTDEDNAYRAGYYDATPLVPSWCFVVIGFLVLVIALLIYKLKKAKTPKNNTPLQ